MILLLTLLGFASVQGRATTYWPGDGHCGSHKADGSRFTAEDNHIAHRNLPLRTRGYVCSVRTGLCAMTDIRDRGPFGALLPCNAVGVNFTNGWHWGDAFGFDKIPKSVGIGKVRRIRFDKKCYWWQAQIKLQPGWTRRGMFDITKPIAKLLKHKPFEKLIFFYKRRSK